MNQYKIKTLYKGVETIEWFKGIDKDRALSLAKDNLFFKLIDKAVSEDYVNREIDLAKFTILDAKEAC